MKVRAIAAHLCAPALITAGTFTAAVSREPFRSEMLVAYILWGFLFYAAPHLLWMVIAAVGTFSAAVWLAGFFASSIDLLAIAACWL
ncbi:MAG: hypothetical protein ACK5PF_05760, partial [bacterium]